MTDKTVNMPRPEYPRPQFERETWVNLNGQWTYSFDFGKSGVERGLQHNTGFDDTILVPFCPESKLSGVEHTDFIEQMWYHRTLVVPEDWDGKRIKLNFGAVDYESDVFIDGQLVGRHWGGTVAFSYDITPFVTPGKTHHLVVHVRDDVRAGTQPAGKQSFLFYSRRCHYTRTTGIWQTVWMEAASDYALEDVQIIPDLDASRFVFAPRLYAEKQGLRFRATVLDGETQVCQIDVVANNGHSYEAILAEPKTWSPENPFLYDVVFEILDADGAVLDTVRSYAGLRKVHIEGNQMYLNNEPIYQRLVLDQGFYIDGIWTAPNELDFVHQAA